MFGLTSSDPCAYIQASHEAAQAREADCPTDVRGRLRIRIGIHPGSSNPNGTHRKLHRSHWRK